MSAEHVFIHSYTMETSPASMVTYTVEDGGQVGL